MHRDRSTIARNQGCITQVVPIMIEIKESFCYGGPHLESFDVGDDVPNQAVGEILKQRMHKKIGATKTCTSTASLRVGVAGVRLFGSRVRTCVHAVCTQVCLL